MTITATVIATAPNSPAPTGGTVVFLDGTNRLGSVPLVNGLATFTTSSLALGTHCLSAGYGGDGNTILGSSASWNIQTVAGVSAVSSFFYPQSVAVDPAGDLFIADSASERVYEINATTGLASTVAGNGVAGAGSNTGGGDGGQATAASFGTVSGLAVDNDNHLFIADGYYNVVREVDLSTGIITTVAGYSHHAYDGSFSGDGDPATAAGLSFPLGLAVDDAGDLFIADEINGRVREVDLSTGIIRTVAGSGGNAPNACNSGDGGPATAATLQMPCAVAADHEGHLFITSGDSVREVDLSTGAIATVAGNGDSGFSGDGGLATAASLDDPGGIAVDSAGNYLYMEDNYRVRKLDLATGMISTVAGGVSESDPGLATAVWLSLDPDPGIALGAAGDFYVCNGDQISLVSCPSSLQVTVLGPRTTPTVSVGAVSRNYNGSPLVATATIAGVSGVASASLEGVGLTLTYYPATTVTGSSGSTMAPSAAGTYIVVASFAGSADYAVAQSSPLTFTIVKAAPSLSVADSSGTYNGQPFPATATAAGIVAGLDNSPAASLEGVAPTLTYYRGTTVNGSGSTMAPSAAGTYTVVASFAGSADYAAAQSAPITFTISQAPLVITTNNASMVYGTGLPALSATYAGFVGGDSEGLVDGPAGRFDNRYVCQPRRHVPDYGRRCGRSRLRDYLLCRHAFGHAGAAIDCG